MNPFYIKEKTEQQQFLDDNIYISGDTAITGINNKYYRLTKFDKAKFKFEPTELNKPLNYGVYILTGIKYDYCFVFHSGGIQVIDIKEFNEEVFKQQVRMYKEKQELGAQKIGIITRVDSTDDNNMIFIHFKPVVGSYDYSGYFPQTIPPARVGQSIYVDAEGNGFIR